MVGWIPKLIYTQTNVAIAFFLLWIKHVYCHWTELTVYMPSTFQEFFCGCLEICKIHWSLLIFLAELAICAGVISGIKRNSPRLTIHASTTERVFFLDVSSIFTIIPVFVTLMTSQVDLQLILFLVCLLFYEIYAFAIGCSNLTMVILGYSEYKITSTDNMSHRLLTQKKIRKGDDYYHVIEFNDIYLEL